MRSAVFARCAEARLPCMKKCSLVGCKLPWAVSMNHNECSLTITYGRKTSFLGSKSKTSYAAFGKTAQSSPLGLSMMTRRRCRQRGFIRRCMVRLIYAQNPACSAVRYCFFSFPRLRAHSVLSGSVFQCPCHRGGRFCLGRSHIASSISIVDDVSGTWSRYATALSRGPI